MKVSGKIVNASNPPPRTIRTFGMNGCANCLLEKQCGGHPLPLIRALGCANYANTHHPLDTDDMSPLFEDRFWELWDDVYGLRDYSVGPLRPMPVTELPEYVPLLQHRSLRHSRLLDAAIVAIPLFDVLGKRKGGGYAPKYKTASALRDAYKLREGTRILLVGVDHDAPLEAFWAHHRLPGVCESLNALGIIGVTAPNFSYFTCVPFFQIMRNRKRILLASERLSEAGVAVAPHINANCEGDWGAAYEFLRDHPEITVVTMEFQTGSRACAEVGREAFDQLVVLQDRVGRSLHPVLVGAARYFKEAKAKFHTFTVIDSQPFLQAISRQILVADEAGRYSWEKSPTPKRAPLDELIETNLLHYVDKLNADSHEGERTEWVNPMQPELAFTTSIPYLTAQPSALGVPEINSAAVSAHQREIDCHSPTV